MAENSVIGAETVVSGHVRGSGSLEILGRVEGDITLTGAVVVGASGRVRGNISAAQLTVAGQVQGDLRGTELVLVERGARVAGDIASPRIGIAPGALVRGHVQTDGEPALAQSGVTQGALGQSAGARRPAAPPARVAALPPAARIAPQPIPASMLKAPHKAEPRKLEPARPSAPASVAAEAESAAVRPVKAEPRRPPPPVVPVISKGTKAKKKKSRD
jgi:cytoskeletal protein CcmA (bactofilin family)